MRLYATIVNEQGKKRNMGGDNYIRIDLTYKNTSLGTLGLYRIIGDDNEDLGYRIALDGKVIKEEETTGKKQKDEIDPLLVAECLHNFQDGICKTCG